MRNKIFAEDNENEVQENEDGEPDDQIEEHKGSDQKDSKEYMNSRYIIQDENGNNINLYELAQMGELGNLDELGDLQNIEGIEETLAKQMKILKDMHKMQQDKSKDGQHKRNKTHAGPERASKVLFDRSPNESPCHLGKDQMDIQEELNLNAEEVLNEEMMAMPSK